MAAWYVLKIHQRVMKGKAELALFRKMPVFLSSPPVRFMDFEPEPELTIYVSFIGWGQDTCRRRCARTHAFVVRKWRNVSVFHTQ